MLNMFRMLIHLSSGACDLCVELFHGLYCSSTMRVGVTLWFGRGGVVSGCRLDVFIFGLNKHGDAKPLQGLRQLQNQEQSRTNNLRQ